MEENIEIDVMKLLMTVKKRLPVIIAAGVICGLLMFLYTRFFSVPMYRSEALVYISNKVAYDTSSETVDLVDMNASNQLGPVYSSLISTYAVLDKVAAASQLPYSAKQISRLMSTEQIEDTAVLRIIVVAPNAEHCAILANTVATTGISEITKIAPGSSAYLIDAAEPPHAPFAPSIPKRVMLGVVAGLVVSAAVFVIRELLDTKIRTEEELSQIINAPILGVVGEQKLPTA